MIESHDSLDGLWGHDWHATESQTKRRFADEEQIIKKALNDSCLKIKTNHKLTLYSKENWFTEAKCLFLWGVTQEGVAYTVIIMKGFSFGL